MKLVNLSVASHLYALAAVDLVAEVVLDSLVTSQPDSVVGLVV